ncbi:MAG: MarR family transcriptional regulator [Thermoplasmata archaeon]
MNRIEKEIIEILMNGSRTQTQLRNELNISKSYLSEILNKMENENYIRREKISERTVLITINKEKILNVGILKATEYAAVFLTQKDLKDLLINIYVFNNALEEMKSLTTEKIDIAFAPIITGFIFHLMDNRIILLSACAKGGSGIIFHKKNGTIGSTMLSTMDFQSRHYLKDFSSIRYFLSPEDMIKSYKKEEIEAISIWEPFFSSFKKDKKIFNGKDHYCCGFLVFKNKINKSILKFQKAFEFNTNELRKGNRIKEASNIMSKFFKMDRNLIEESMNNYEFINEIEKNDIISILKSFGINTDEKIIKNYLE